MEYVTLFQKQLESEKEMFLICDEQLNVNAISRNVAKLLKIQPYYVHQFKVNLKKLAPELDDVTKFFTEEFLTLQIPTSL